MKEPTILRNSERQLFKKCQWRWEREYIDRLKLRGKDSMALWFGTGIHLAMEKWYVAGRERGVDPRETWREYVMQSKGDTAYVNTYHDGDFEEAISALELGEDMLTGYLEHYGPEENIEVISAEQSFQVKVPYKNLRDFQHLGDGFTGHFDDEAYFVGTFDQVYRDTTTGKLWLRDWKTCAQLGASATQYLPLDDQAGSYMAVADYTLRKQGLIGENERIEGIVYDYLVKAKRDVRPRNEDGLACNKPQKKHYIEALGDEGIDKMKVADLKSLAEQRGIPVYGEVSATQPRQLFDRVTVRRNPTERRTQINRIQNDLSHMSLVRNGVLPAMKSPSRECSFCPFLEICELDEQGKSWDNMRDTVFQPWSPYEDHLKGIET